MAVQVNTFLLCQGIKNPKGILRDFIKAPQCSFYPLNGKFPIRHVFMGYMLLRRDSSKGKLEFNATLKCIDEDVHHLFKPLKFQGYFGDGELFFPIEFKINMNIPKAGDYEIDLDLFSGGVQTEYSYGFQVKEKAV